MNTQRTVAFLFLLIFIQNSEAQNSSAPTVSAPASSAPTSASSSAPLAPQKAQGVPIETLMTQPEVTAAPSQGVQIEDLMTQPTVNTAQDSASSAAVEGEVVALAEAPLPNEKLARLEKQIKLLKEMVDIGSDTKIEVAGVNKVQMIAARELKALKFKVEEVENPDPFTKSGKLIVATFPGKSEQYITLLAHADTVFPAFTGFVKFERLDETTAKGPGVIDNKGGIVVGIEALRTYLTENPTPNYSLRFVISPSEEVGSTGFLNLFEQYSLTSVAVFGLEPALDAGDIVSSRRGDRWYDVTIKGREAHAGRAHDQGVNACHELAIKIEKLQKLTNYKKEVSINIGSIKGGKDKFAIVCGEASMKLDVRFSDMLNREKVIKSVESILKTQYVRAKSDGARATTEWKIVDDPKPFPENPQGRNLIAIYQKVIQDLEGAKIQARRSGGTSDLNFFYRPGIVMIDGLGPVGSGMHTHDEKIVLRSLLSRSDALAKLIQATAL